MFHFYIFIECDSQCSEEASPMEVPHVLAIGSLVPIQKSSPERRNQKEIIAGEERPKFLTIKQDAQGKTHLLFVPLSLTLSLYLYYPLIQKINPFFIKQTFMSSDHVYVLFSFLYEINIYIQFVSHTFFAIFCFI